MGTRINIAVVGIISLFASYSFAGASQSMGTSDATSSSAGPIVTSAAPTTARPVTAPGTLDKSFAQSGKMIGNNTDLKKVRATPETDSFMALFMQDARSYDHLGAIGKNYIPDAKNGVSRFVADMASSTYFKIAVGKEVDVTNYGHDSMFLTRFPANYPTGYNSSPTTTVVNLGASSRGNTAMVYETWGIIAGEAAIPNKNYNGFAITAINGQGSNTCGEDKAIISDLGNGASVDVLLKDPKVNSRFIAAGYLHPMKVALVAYKIFECAVDTTFGNNGVSIINIDKDFSEFSLAFQKDGSLVVAGTQKISPQYNDIVVQRITPQGQIDSTFGTNGKVGIHINGYDLITANTVVSDVEGRIYIGGSIAKSSNDFTKFLVIRLLPDGKLDAGFGSNGVSIISTSGRPGKVLTLDIDAKGHLIVGGSVIPGPTDQYKWVIVKLFGGGSLPQASSPTATSPASTSPTLDSASLGISGTSDSYSASGTSGFVGNQKDIPTSDAKAPPEATQGAEQSSGPDKPKAAEESPKAPGAGAKSDESGKTADKGGNSEKASAVPGEVNKEAPGLNKKSDQDSPQPDEKKPEKINIDIKEDAVIETDPKQETTDSTSQSLPLQNAPTQDAEANSNAGSASVGGCSLIR